MDFPEFTINFESQWEFQLTISEILSHHNQRLPRNLHFNFLVSIHLLKKLIMLERFYINMAGCVRVTSYWSETIFIISLKKNIDFVNFCKTPFGSNIIASFTKFQCQGIDTSGSGFVRVQTFEFHIQGIFVLK